MFNNYKKKKIFFFAVEFILKDARPANYQVSMRVQIKSLKITDGLLKMNQ